MTDFSSKSTTSKVDADVSLAPRELYKIRRLGLILSFLKVFWGTSVVGIVSVCIPALLEKYKADYENQKWQQEYIKNFEAKGSDQDIELRIRLAEYFSHLANDQIKPSWARYHQTLLEKRNSERNKIIEINRLIADLEQQSTKDAALELENFKRELRWRHAQLAPLQKDDYVTDNLHSAFKVQRVAVYFNIHNKKTELSRDANKIRERLITLGHRIFVLPFDPKDIDLDDIPQKERSSGTIHIAGQEKTAEFSSDLRQTLSELFQDKLQDQIILSADWPDDKSVDVDIYLF